MSYRRHAERVQLIRRKDRLHLKGVKVAASTERDPFSDGHYHHPPKEWLKALFAATPKLAHNHSLWTSEEHRDSRYAYGYRGYWAPPYLALRIHLCAECETVWYVAHYAVRRCEACECEHRQSDVRAANARMIAGRAEQRADARTEMACEQCFEPMTGGRLRRYCKPSCRQAAYRDRQAAGVD